MQFILLNKIAKFDRKLVKQNHKLEMFKTKPSTIIVLSEMRDLAARVDLFVGEIFVPTPDLQQLFGSSDFSSSESCVSMFIFLR